MNALVCRILFILLLQLLSAKKSLKIPKGNIAVT